ncbi:MAG TPA: lycopene beta-cyclase CrtY, partial [Myxococcaceae bacterium]|nr:lycopene beta-cyclase CrtY [Myxococcaceae bacterium]
KYDYVLVGGGLQNGLIALALRGQRPDARIALLERGAALGGNHLWSFHAGDVPDDARAFVDPLVEHRWSRYHVRFPRLERDFAEPYSSIPSHRLDRVVRERLGDAPGCAVRLGAEVVEVAPGEVTLAGGERLSGELVVDARGPESLGAGGATGYQKFVGLEVRVAPEVCPREPTLMDATVPQSDGLRFMYVLPLAADRVLVEDTRFSDTPALNVDALRDEVLGYMRARGLGPLEVLRQETGVLPLPWRLDVAPPAPGLLVAGYQGGWFHPTTGYSLPVAVRLARTVARHPPSALFASDDFRALTTTHEDQLRFCLLLSRLMFTAFPPGERWNVMERFHRLPVDTIRRFYAMTLTRADRLRIICGRPPQGMSLRRVLASTEVR